MMKNKYLIISLIIIAAIAIIMIYKSQSDKKKRVAAMIDTDFAIDTTTDTDSSGNPVVYNEGGQALAPK